MNTQWLPCVSDLAPYLSSEVMEILQVRGKPLPFLHHALGSMCEHRHCQHHVFHTPLRKDRGREGQRYKETEFTRQICNCMCLIDFPVNQAEIAEAFDVRLSWVQEIEARALRNMKEHMADYLN